MPEILKGLASLPQEQLIRKYYFVYQCETKRNYAAPIFPYHLLIPFLNREEPDYESGGREANSYVWPSRTIASFLPSVSRLRLRGRPPSYQWRGQS